MNNPTSMFLDKIAQSASAVRFQAIDLFNATKMSLANNDTNNLNSNHEDWEDASELPTVIQHEGWLLKRGAGYKNESDVHGSSTNSRASGSFADDGSETGLGIASNRTTLVSKLNASSVISFVRGKDEKKRYFVLLTTRGKGGRRGESPGNGGGPKAELRYFKQKPLGDNLLNFQGIIRLEQGMQVTLSETTLKLYTPERTFYLRQDPDEMQPAKARTSASQWLNAIQFSVQGLKGIEERRKTGGRFEPVNVHPLHSAESSRVVAVTLDGGSASRKTTREQEEEDKICPYVKLWQRHGIEAYDAVIAHFGPVQTDLQRLLDNFKSRVAQLQLEIHILEDQMGHSNEVTVKEQKTMALALRSMYKLDTKYLALLKEAMRDLSKEVVDPLELSIREIGNRLESIVATHSTSASYVEGAKRALNEADEKVFSMTAFLSPKLTALLGNNNNATSPKNGGPTSTHAANANNSNTAPVVSEVTLNEARRARRDAEQMLVAVEAKAAEAITNAMVMFYELEKYRFERIIHVLEQASNIESRLQTKTAVDSGLEAILGQIDAPKDIRSTFAKLKALGEKSRPNGRMRRKNSMVTRTLMELLPPEGEADENDDEEEA